MPKKISIAHMIENVKNTLEKASINVTEATDIWVSFASKNSKQEVLKLFTKQDKATDVCLLLHFCYAFKFCLEVSRFITDQLEQQAYKGLSKQQLETKQIKISKMIQFLINIPSKEINDLIIQVRLLIGLSTSISTLYETICDEATLGSKDLQNIVLYVGNTNSQRIDMNGVIQNYLNLDDKLSYNWCGAELFLLLLETAYQNKEVSEIEHQSWFKIFLLSFMFSSEKLSFEQIAPSEIDPRIASIQLKKMDKKRLDASPDQLSHFEKLELLFKFYREKKQALSKHEASLLLEEEAAKERGRSRTKKKIETNQKPTHELGEKTPTNAKTTTQSTNNSDDLAVDTPKKSSSPPPQSTTASNPVRTREASPFVSSSTQQAAVVRLKKDISVKNKKSVKERGKWLSDFLTSPQTPKASKKLPKIEFKGPVTTQSTKNKKKKNTKQTTTDQANQTDTLSTLPPLIQWELSEPVEQITAVDSSQSSTTQHNESVQHNSAPATTITHAPQFLFTPAMIVDQQGMLWDTKIHPNASIFKIAPVGVQCLWWAPELSRFVANYYPDCIPVCYVLDISNNGVIACPLLQTSPVSSSQTIFCALAFYIQTQDKTTYTLDADLFGTPIASTKKPIDFSHQVGFLNYLSELKTWQENISIDTLFAANQQRKLQITSQLPVITEE